MKKAALLNLYDKLTQCICDCPGERVGAGLVRDRGNPETGIILLGEAPGSDEILTGIPFIGQAGRKLDGYLELAGLSRNSLFIINSVKCRPTKNSGRANRRPNSCEIKTCSHWLEEELQIIKPGVIITLGEVALKKFGGNKIKIGNYHGQPLLWEQYAVFPMYHPAASIYRRSLEEIIKDDFVKLGHWLKHNCQS